MTERVAESPGAETPLFPGGEQRSSAVNTRTIELENEKEMGKRMSSLSCCHSSALWSLACKGKDQLVQVLSYLANSDSSLLHFPPTWKKRRVELIKLHSGPVVLLPHSRVKIVDPVMCITLETLSYML